MAKASTTAITNSRTFQDETTPPPPLRPTPTSTLPPSGPPPLYVTSLDEFELDGTLCPLCDGPLTFLRWRMPPDEDRMIMERIVGVGGARSEVRRPAGAPTGNVNHLLPFLVGSLSGRACRRCLIRLTIPRVCPDPPVGIVDPAKHALEELKASLAPPKPPREDGPPGAAFPMGHVRITEAALWLLGSTIREELPREARIGLGHNQVKRYLARHGDLANHAVLSEAELAEARAAGPKASVAQQNAVAIRDGIGTIYSPFLITRKERHVGGDAQTLHTWTELAHPTCRVGSHRVATTLIWTQTDDVRME